MCKYNKGDKVLVRVNLISEPQEAIWIRSTTKEEEEDLGYRSGEIVKLSNGTETWVRSDLCEKVG